MIGSGVDSEERKNHSGWHFYVIIDTPIVFEIESREMRIGV